MTYPVLDIVDELRKKLSENSAVILQAPPGAGKSTILPLQLLDEAWLDGKKIIMLEPRRLAARSVAHRMSSLMQENAGETIGYRIRFESVISSKTRIEVVTEGILTRMIQQDNALEDVGLVVFDEFHERSLQADLALALCQQVQQVLRPDLRILIMSATLDGERISTALGHVPIVTSLGRQYPVTFVYHPESDAPIHVRITRILQKAMRENSGDILVFIPGAAEIARTQELIEAENISAVVHALYGDLPMKKQQDAITPDPHGQRKIVLATAIAETSLTIEGISVVIDSGLSRVPRFDPRSGLTRLETVRVTKDSADQRAGRAGRLGPGVCYRLWSEGSHMHLVPQRTPEILDADLSSMMLELNQWGVKNINELRWITIPPAGSVKQASELLDQLEAIDEHGITLRGKEMLKLPTHPRIAHMLLEAKAEDKKLLTVASDIAALLEERDPLSRESGADLSLRVDALRKWRSGERVNADRGALERVERLAASWRRIFKLEADNTNVSEYIIGKLLADAYPERIAKQVQKNGERFKLSNGRVVNLPSHDGLTRETWLSVAHVDAGGGGEGKIFIAAPLNEDDLQHLAHEHRTVKWDAERGMVLGVVEKRIAGLILSSKPLPSIEPEERIKVLCDVINERGLKMIGWDEPQMEWQRRVMSTRAWRKEESWPDVSDENLLESTEAWLSPFLTNVSRQSELSKLELNSILQSILPWDLNAKLDELAPSRIEVPSGSMIKVNYHGDERLPFMEVRLQELFGLLETPTVNEGRTKITIHLLSPGYKPVQITQDLKSFWKNTYHEVRSELQRRYPRHSWPEDPWTAKAVRGVVKRRN